MGQGCTASSCRPMGTADPPPVSPLAGAAGLPAMAPSPGRRKTRLRPRPHGQPVATYVARGHRGQEGSPAPSSSEPSRTSQEFLLLQPVPRLSGWGSVGVGVSGHRGTRGALSPHRGTSSLECPPSWKRSRPDTPGLSVTTDQPLGQAAGAPVGPGGPPALGPVSAELWGFSVCLFPCCRVALRTKAENG